jgi:hypothetical protein
MGCGGMARAGTTTGEVGAGVRWVLLEGDTGELAGGAEVPLSGVNTGGSSVKQQKPKDFKSSR